MLDAHALEDLTLLLIGETDVPPMWLDRWALSYPLVRRADVSPTQGIAAWQRVVGEAFAQTHGCKVAVVAHGAGVSAFLAWLYQADILAQKALCNIILVSPRLQAFPDDACHTLQRARCPCRAALVIGENEDCGREWAQQHADLWRARLLVSPHAGRLDGALGGWQWGMKLMQEMLLA